MAITEELFVAFLNCETKAHLLELRGTSRTPSLVEDWRQRCRAAYESNAVDTLRSSLEQDEWADDALQPPSIVQRQHRYVFNYTIEQSGIKTCIPALELDPRAGQHPYLPIRFIPDEKLGMNDKLLLAFDGLALYYAFGKMPNRGKIVHSQSHARSVVPLAKLVEKIRPIIRKLVQRQAEGDPPPLVLNRHCIECQFESRCRALAIEKDELSLLSHVTAKDRQQQNAKGIFTVTQLSYTFRPRRRPTRGH